MTIPSDQLYLSEHNYVDRVMMDNNRPPAVLRNAQTLYNTGRLIGTGHLSILPVGQGVRHSARVSFTVDLLYFNPKNTVELTIEIGCNCVASTYGVLVSVSRHYAYRIPSLVRINYNETLSYPNTLDQTLYTSVEQAFSMDTVAVKATIYSSSEGSCRQTEEILAAFERAYELGTVTALWVYLCSSVFKKDGMDYHVSADPIGQANHLAATIGADIVKRKMMENNGGYKAANFGYTDDCIYTKLASENPIDPVCYQLTNCHTGRARLTSSGGAAGGDADLSDVARAAAINECVGGTGLTLGCRALEKIMTGGIKLTNAIQSAYLDSKVIIA